MTTSITLPERLLTLVTILLALYLADVTFTLINRILSWRLDHLRKKLKNSLDPEDVKYTYMAFRLAGFELDAKTAYIIREVDHKSDALGGSVTLRDIA